MRIFLFAFLFLFTSLILRAQRSNFVYIQSEPARLFSLIIKGDTLTSSKTGYLILSKLTDSAYQIAISFKEQTWPTQYFTLGVFQTDQGYLLKDYGDKGWGLLDWRSLRVQYGEKNNSTSLTKPSVPAEQDEFSNLLAMAAGDPSLRARVENKQAEAVAKQPLKNGESADTVQKAPMAKEVAVVKEEIAKSDSISINKDTAVQIKPILNTKDTITLLQDSPLITNPRCSAIATQDEMDLLVRSIDSVTNDVKRVLLISKSLQKFCLSVAQVAVLAEKFTTDEGRYDFLLEAWFYVSNRSQFDRLFHVFRNPDFAVRLKEMLQ